MLVKRTEMIQHQEYIEVNNSNKVADASCKKYTYFRASKYVLEHGFEQQ